ncbi:MAG: STAS domain-containing protein [Pseudomonadota bacterium]|nr:STAS domain-containing protein [Pseudomonadota bacterium]
MNPRPEVGASVRGRQAGQLDVSGRVDYTNVAALRAEGEQWIATQPGPSLTIDLAALQAANSLTISLLLCWLRAAAAADRTLCFDRVPAPLLSMMRVSGLDEVLPLCGPPERADPMP